MILKRGSSGADVKNMQEYLTALGYDTKGVEGTFEGGTESAVKAFQKDMSFTVVDGIIGNQTAKHLVDMYYGKVVPFGYITNTPWVSEAIEDYFVSEIKGEKHNPRVVQYFKDAHSSWFTDDETPWCAAAVSSWLERVGIRSVRSARARDHINFGTKLLEPRFGAIVVLERGANSGHVGFVNGVTADGKQIKVLGGNQSDSVNERMFQVTRVLGYRQPEGFVLPPCPIVGKGELSKSEA
ncbi:putative baseplate hub subunit and tail lysozyme [Vibrio phage ICP1]|nr:putative baseplate hub subunit and tail lysozyme [Vibrio phage ICP1]